jgi:hypothetical protein
MEILAIRRVAYWVSFFIFMALLLVFAVAERLPVLFRVILIVLLAFLSAMFRLEDRYSFLSFVITIVAGIATGAVLANNTPQFWVFAFMYIILFFLSCEVLERKLLGI